MAQASGEEFGRLTQAGRKATQPANEPAISWRKAWPEKTKPNYELIPGSLLEVTLGFNKRNSLSIPDTSIILEGNKAYVYKVSEDNIASRLEIKIGLRENGNVEVISGLNSGDIIVAEGLKKVRPNSKIKPLSK